MSSPKTILLTIDVEDWFQVENFRPWIPFDTWDQCDMRVEKNTYRLLDFFDSITLAGRLEVRNQEAKNKHVGKKTIDKGYSDSDKEEPSSFQAFQPQADDNELKSNGQQTVKNGNSVPANGKLSSLPAFQPSSYSRPKATFFVLGWLAERLPLLVREIHSRGHEVASHGYNHNLCNQQSPSDLKRELTDSKKLLEDITGSQVFGFRAPNFSIDDDVLKIIEDCDYLYDSSYNSFGLHSRYGQISLNGHRQRGIAIQISEKFFELPISNLKVAGKILPWGGGAYFRLMPLPVFEAGLKNILKTEQTYLSYLHPWEFDSKQPKLDNASYLSRFKHYSNIKQTEKKLKRLIQNLRDCQFITCLKYLDQSK